MRLVLSVIFCATFVIALVSCASLERIRPEAVREENVGANDLGQAKFDEKTNVEHLGLNGPFTEDDLECDEESDEEAVSNNDVIADQSIAIDVVTPNEENDDELECDDEEDEDVTSLPTEPTIPVEILTPDPSEDIECNEKDDSEPTNEAISADLTEVPEVSVVEQIQPEVKDMEPVEPKAVETFEEPTILEPLEEEIQPEKPEVVDSEPVELETIPEVPEVVVIDELEIPAPAQIEVEDLVSAIPVVNNEQEISGPVEFEKKISEFPVVVDIQPKEPKAEENETVEPAVEENPEEVEAVKPDEDENDEIIETEEPVEFDNIISEIPEVITIDEPEIEDTQPESPEVVETKQQESEDSEVAVNVIIDDPQVEEDSQKEITSEMPIESKPVELETIPEVPEVVVIDELEIPTPIEIAVEDLVSAIPVVEETIPIVPEVVVNNEQEPVEFDEKISEFPVVVDIQPKEPEAVENELEQDVKLTEVPEVVIIDKTDITTQVVEEIIPELEDIQPKEPKAAENETVEPAVEENPEEVEAVKIDEDENDEIIETEEPVESDEIVSEIPEIIIIDEQPEIEDTQLESPEVVEDKHQESEDSEVAVNEIIDDPQVEKDSEKELTSEMPIESNPVEPEVLPKVHEVVEANELEIQDENDAIIDTEEPVESDDIVSEIPEIIIIDDQPEIEDIQPESSEVVDDKQQESEDSEVAVNVIIDDPQVEDDSEKKITSEMPVESKPVEPETLPEVPQFIALDELEILGPVVSEMEPEPVENETVEPAVEEKRVEHEIIDAEEPVEKEIISEMPKVDILPADINVVESEVEDIISATPTTEISKPCDIEKIMNRLRSDFGGKIPYALQYLLRSYENWSPPSETTIEDDASKTRKYPVTLFPVQWIPVPIMPSASWGTYPNPWSASSKSPCDAADAKVEEPSEKPSLQWLPYGFGRQ